MKDTLYETILNPAQIDTLHAGTIALQRMYGEIINKIEREDPDVQDWMQKHGLAFEMVYQIYENAKQMVYQFDHFILGTELPADANKAFTVNFHEAFEQFDQN